ncbi:MAG: lysophospholipase [Pseudobutyrivibrio sp.]|nr:lysophospholipase [Pseudobutyrivibrio sp.]
MVEQVEYSFDSADGISKIHGRKWIPQGEPIAVIQLVHGMVEYIERYDEFACFLADQGFLVVGHDHIGHGHSVSDDSQLGVMRGKHPSDFMVEDILTNYKLTVAETKDLPYFILGHSMGSYMLRKALAVKAGEFSRLSGAIIVGTGQESAITCRFGLAVIGLVSTFRGKNYRSKLIREMTYSTPYKQFDCYGKDYSRSWLSKNIQNIEKYYQDKYCTYTFTANAYKGLVETTLYDSSLDCLSKTKKDIPYLIASGGQDPVGNLGKGPEIVATAYRRAGIKDVTLQIYKGDRHEILNEVDREQVYQDILKWMKDHM